MVRVRFACFSSVSLAIIAVILFSTRIIPKVRCSPVQSERSQLSLKVETFLKFLSHLLSTAECVGAVEVHCLCDSLDIPSVLGSLSSTHYWSIKAGRAFYQASDVISVIERAKPVLRFVRHTLSAVILGRLGQSSLKKSLRANTSSPFEYFVFYQLNYKGDLVLAKASIFNLKNKIEVVITSSTSISLLQVFSLCFYCNGGLPSLFQLDPESTPFEIMFSDTTTNLNGTRLRVTSSKGNSRSMNYKDLENGTVIFDGGYSHKIFFALQQKYGFNYEFELANGFGIMMPNGSLTGVIGALQRGEYDMAMEAGLKSERFAVTEYMPPGVYECLTFLTRIPRSKPNWELMYAPLNSQTWTAVGCSVVVFAVGFNVLISLSNLMVHQRAKINQSIHMGVQFVVSSLLYQSWEPGGRLVWSTTGLRLAVVAWLFPVIVLGTAYTAKLTTLMAYPQLERVPSSFEELGRSDYKIYLHDMAGGLPEFIFRTTTNPNLIQMRSRLIKEKSLFKCIEETVKGRAACVTLGWNGMFEASKNFSNAGGRVMVRMAPTNLYPFLPGAPILRKGQPFAQHFARAIRIMFDMGLMYKFQADEDTTQVVKGRRWARDRVSHEPWRRPESDGEKPLRLEEIIGIFNACGTLIIAAFAVFLLVERLRYRIICLSRYLYKRWRNVGVIVVSSAANDIIARGLDYNRISTGEHPNHQEYVSYGYASNASGHIKYKEDSTIPVE